MVCAFLSMVWIEKPGRLLVPAHCEKSTPASVIRFVSISCPILREEWRALGPAIETLEMPNHEHAR
jgi:hypothetical protein